ncbi:MAG: MlaD family protein [Limisphaerales bacterium]
MNKLHNGGRLAERPLPSAVIKKAKPAWLLWLIPLSAAALCVWFIYRDYVAAGPLITIYFQNAEGLQEGNTAVQYRGAQVGEVKSIALADRAQRVKVTARLSGSARDLARAGSLFWIVRPEVKVGAITGLNTIVSGEYITVQPGQGAPTNVFAAAEQAPPTEEPGDLLITVHAPNLESLQDRSPIFYRGIQVGDVLSYQLAENSQGVMVQARIRKEFAPLVRVNSKFWNAGGIDFHLGLFKGAELSALSPQTLFSGGIEFATPPDVGPPAQNGAVFQLNDKPKDAWKDWTPSIALQLPGHAPRTSAPANSPLELK